MLQIQVQWQNISLVHIFSGLVNCKEKRIYSWKFPFRELSVYMGIRLLKGLWSQIDLT